MTQEYGIANKRNKSEIIFGGQRKSRLYDEALSHKITKKSAEITKYLFELIQLSVTVVNDLTYNV